MAVDGWGGVVGYDKRYSGKSTCVGIGSLEDVEVLVCSGVGLQSAESGDHAHKTLLPQNKHTLCVAHTAA